MKVKLFAGSSYDAESDVNKWLAEHQEQITVLGIQVSGGGKTMVVVGVLYSPLR